MSSLHKYGTLRPVVPYPGGPFPRKNRNRGARVSLIVALGTIFPTRLQFLHHQSTMQPIIKCCKYLERNKLLRSEMCSDVPRILVVVQSAKKEDEADNNKKVHTHPREKTLSLIKFLLIFKRTPRAADGAASIRAYAGGLFAPFVSLDLNFEPVFVSSCK